MKYLGSRLKDLLNSERGRYTELAGKMGKYRKPRSNGSKDEYNLGTLYKDGHNIKLDTLTALLRETGLSIDYFVEFEPGELPTGRYDSISGSNNIVNSSITNDLTMKMDHLNEVIRLKDEMLVDKERIISLKDEEIRQWKKRYDDLFKLAQFGGSDRNETK